MSDNKPSGMDDLDDTIIDIQGMSFYRGSRAIFNDISLKIPRGKITAIMGPSGTGKTTLLKLIGGQIRPENGSISIDGQNVPKLNRKDLFKVRSRMGMLFQSGALFSDLSVFENVAFPIRVHTDLPDDMIEDLVLMKLQAVGLRGAVKLMPSELSGGMARRVALARAVALDPDILMYDEPFAGQDPIAMGVLVQLIKTLNKNLGLTSIVVSHDIQETLSIADYIYVVSGGKVIAHGTTSELLDDSSPEVKQFMQGFPDGPVPFHFPAGDYLEELLGINP